VLRLAAVKCRSEAEPEGAEASTAFVAARSCTSALDSGSRTKRRCLTREKHGKKNQHSAERIRSRFGELDQIDDRPTMAVGRMGLSVCFFCACLNQDIEGGGPEMFSHFQRHGKCEWIGGGLERFVAHYNRECGTAYAHSQCLDVVKIGGNPRKEPEVLLTDEKTSGQMVIESKSVVWPPHYILRHENEHAFADTIWEVTKGCYVGGCWELVVSGKEMDRLDNRPVRKIARSIGSSLVSLKSSDQPVRSLSPVNWVFRKAGGHEHGEHRGIVVSYQDGMSPEDFCNDEAKAGTASAIQDAVVAAAAKFEKYQHVRRVVLLDFYGRDLDEEDIPPLMTGIEIPETVDEIWMSRRDWVSAEDFEIGYQRLFNQ
jgi:hypothetical protein